MVGTSAIASQRSWICWRVVMSASPRPCSLARAPSVLTWAASVRPFGIRIRIMKCPGVRLRRKTPHHLRRSTSPSEIASTPSSAKRGMSAPTSSPSFSALMTSILFTRVLLERAATKKGALRGRESTLAFDTRPALGAWDHRMTNRMPALRGAKIGEKPEIHAEVGRRRNHSMLTAQAPRRPLLNEQATEADFTTAAPCRRGWGRSTV